VGCRLPRPALNAIQHTSAQVHVQLPRILTLHCGADVAGIECQKREPCVGLVAAPHDVRLTAVQQQAVEGCTKLGGDGPRGDAASNRLHAQRVSGNVHSDNLRRLQTATTVTSATPPLRNNSADDYMRWQTIARRAQRRRCW